MSLNAKHLIEPGNGGTGSSLLELETHPAESLDGPLAASLSETFDLLGLSISALPFQETLARLVRAPTTGEKLRVHFCALHTLVEAARDESLRDSLNRANLLAPDGTPLVWLGRSQGLRVERVCG